MKIIIIAGVIILIIYLLRKLFYNALCYDIVIIEYKEFKRLKHLYSNARLHRLKKHCERALKRLNGVLESDTFVLKQVQKPDEISFWQKEVHETQQMLEKFQDIDKDVLREIKAREFFKAQR